MKLIDFGLAARIEFDNGQEVKLTSLTGTTYYVSPQVSYPLLLNSTVTLNALV